MVQHCQVDPYMMKARTHSRSEHKKYLTSIDIFEYSRVNNSFTPVTKCNQLKCDASLASNNLWLSHCAFMIPGSPSGPNGTREILCYNLESCAIEMTFQLDNSDTSIYDETLPNNHLSHNRAEPIAYITCLSAFNDHEESDLREKTIHYTAVSNCANRHAHDRVLVFGPEPGKLGKIISVPGYVINMTVNSDYDLFCLY